MFSSLRKWSSNFSRTTSLILRLLVACPFGCFASAIVADQSTPRSSSLGSGFEILTARILLFFGRQLQKMNRNCLRTNSRIMIIGLISAQQAMALLVFDANNLKIRSDCEHRKRCYELYCTVVELQ